MNMIKKIRSSTAQPGHHHDIVVKPRSREESMVSTTSSTRSSSFLLKDDDDFAELDFDLEQLYQSGITGTHYNKRFPSDNRIIPLELLPEENRNDIHIDLRHTTTTSSSRIKSFPTYYDDEKEETIAATSPTSSQEERESIQSMPYSVRITLGKFGLDDGDDDDDNDDGGGRTSSKYETRTLISTSKSSMQNDGVVAHHNEGDDDATALVVNKESSKLLEGQATHEIAKEVVASPPQPPQEFKRESEIPKLKQQQGRKRKQSRCSFWPRYLRWLISKKRTSLLGR